MKVIVTQDHIDHGYPGTPSSCPVALALKETSTDFANVIVGPFWFSSRNEEFQITYGVTNLPKKVQQFIRKFDTSKPVKPFLFEI